MASPLCPSECDKERLRMNSSSTDRFTVVSVGRTCMERVTAERTLHFSLVSHFDDCPPHCQNKTHFSFQVKKLVCVWVVSKTLIGTLLQLAAFPALCAVFGEPRHL